MVHAGLAGQARVDDDGNVGDGETGLGHRCRQHDPTTCTRLKGRVLVCSRLAAVQPQDLHIGTMSEATRNLVDLGCAR